MNVIVTGGVFPLYISKISAVEQTIVLDITDTQGNTNLFILLNKDSSSIVDQDGRLSGTIMVQP